MRTNLYRVLVVTAGLLLPTLGHAQTDQFVVRQDGIVASLLPSAETVELKWYFSATPPAEVDGVTAEYNGRPLTATSVTEYPGEADSTVVLCIVDVSGGAARDADIGERKGMAGTLLAMVQPHHRVGLYSAVGGLSSAAEANGAAMVSLEALAAFGISEQVPDLGSSIGKAIEIATSIETTRRGIVLFTDGHSNPAPDFAALSEAARAGHVKVYVYLTRGNDPTGADAWKSFAEGTGGGFYTGDEAIVASLTDPFELLDSGATAEISLAGAVHYFWEPAGPVHVTVSYGDRDMHLEAPVTVPEADLGQTTAYVWEHYGNTIGFSLAAVGWLLALALLPFAFRKRRPAAATAAEVHSAPAKPAGPLSKSGPTQPLPENRTYRLTWADPSSGQKTGFAVTGARVTVGRSRDNTIVIAGDTVSGHQAVFIRGEAGAYSVVNLSETNPTLVNEESVQTRELKGGERLRFGLVEALFEV
ncbi:FHA domain-containing protein [Devosia sp. CN2-171]|uniref:FHA domain-containing protein n=1 Tax=Devosia sp. CN2-171 TaxID=3400909 RepID=UPI003BF9192C